MKFAFRLSLAAAALCCTMATPVMAQGSTAASPEQELAQLRAEMAALAARVDQLEGELVQARVEAAAADTERAAITAATPVDTKPVTTITFKGAPEIETESGWSFKPRGRLQYDAGFTSVPKSTGRSDGFGNELRRARLGVQGDMPGGFGYKFEWISLETQSNLPMLS